MTQRRRRVPQKAKGEAPPKLSKQQVHAALKQSSKGSNELGRELKEVFALSDASASLRLR